MLTPESQQAARRLNEQCPPENNAYNRLDREPSAQKIGMDIAGIQQETLPPVRLIISYSTDPETGEQRMSREAW